MNIDIYRSETDASKYLCVQAGVDPTTIRFNPIDPDLRSIAVFKRDVPLDPARPPIGFNLATLVEDIARQDYSVQQVTITVSMRGA